MENHNFLAIKLPGDLAKTSREKKHCRFDHGLMLDKIRSYLERPSGKGKKLFRWERPFSFFRQMGEAVRNVVEKSIIFSNP